MALQSSGAISLNDIHTEVGATSGTSCSMGDSDLRTLAGDTSGAISMSQWYGKRFCTVAEWNSYCATITSTTRLGSQTYASTGWVRVTSPASSGTMWGSPRGNAVTSDSALNRVSQHMVGSSTEWNWIVSNGVQILIYQRNYGSWSTFTAATYNGYTSSSFGTFDANDSYQCRWLYNGTAYSRVWNGSPSVLAVG